MPTGKIKTPMNAPNNNRHSESSQTVLYALAFAFYALCAWCAASFVGVGSPAVVKLTVLSGGLFLLGAESYFVLAGYLRKRGVHPFGEYAVAAVSRSGVILLCVLTCLAVCPDDLRRNYAIRVLIAYFATFPVHVWLTLPAKR